MVVVVVVVLVVVVVVAVAVAEEKEIVLFVWGGVIEKRKGVKGTVAYRHRIRLVAGKPMVTGKM